MSIEEKKTTEVCPYMKKCGGCQLQGVPYAQQLKDKEKQVKDLIGPYCRVFPITGMETPYLSLIIAKET